MSQQPDSFPSFRRRIRHHPRPPQRITMALSPLLGPVAASFAMEDGGLSLLLKGALLQEQRAAGFMPQPLPMGLLSSRPGDASGHALTVMADIQKEEEEPADERATDTTFDSDDETAAEAASLFSGAVASSAEAHPASLLLAFTRAEPSPPAPRPAPPRRASPASHTSNPLKRRGVADRASQFTCRHPGCGKSYGCPDAVRKHCRKQHADWLKGLGHVGPAGYCSWEQGI